MIPPSYDIELYQGDSFGDGWVITIPDLTSRGGPADLTGANVTAQIRAKQDPASEVFATFDVVVLDAALRRVSPRLTPEQTAVLTKKGYWDLQVEDPATGWVGTVLRGEMALIKEVTRVAP